MINTITANGGVSFILVLLEGILSFFSPCVIPLIPVYMGYLAGNGKKINEDGTITYERKKVFLHTLFFILGISVAFFILGMSFTTLGSFFSANKILFTRIGGILIVLMGLFQLGVLDFAFLQKERKIHFNLADKEMNPVLALLMGFTFSFAWTPCIGPALSSVLIMAGGAATSIEGNLLVIVYAIGFLFPFLLLGLFTTSILNFLKSKQKLLKYTIKAGAVILILMGIMTFTGWMNGVSGYLNSLNINNQGVSQNSEDTVTTDSSTNENANSNVDASTTDASTTDATSTDASVSGTTTTDASNTDTSVASEDSSATEAGSAKVIPEYDFTLVDQYGTEHTLSDYKGKVVFLNFWATWCPPCKKELPDIEALYQEYNLNADDVVFLGVANPASDEYPNNQDVSKEEVISFLSDNGYTFPVLFDETGDILKNYNISAFPTTFIIDKNGNILGYVPGMMTKDIMKNVINQALESTN